MEKLQKALKKARKERGMTGGVSSDGQGRSSGLLPRAKRKIQETAIVPVAPFPPAWDQLTAYEPNPDLLLKNRIMTLNAQATPNPFDILRTKVFLLMRQNGWTRMAITSPTKGCGKTTTACNLAVGFSRQRENKTMLFDVDLRRPGIANLLGRKPQHGIKSMLVGDVRPEDQLLKLRSNVALSLARNSVSDPTQLLLAQRTTEVFNEIQEKFVPDVMIFDLPPMLVTDDARAFLKNVDCALIVARSEQTKMAQLDTCEREVGEHTNVLGVVLNNCRHLSDEEEYYGEYE